MITHLHESAAFQPTRNIDAFFLAQLFRTSVPFATHLISIIMRKSIYMHFTSICNICQGLYCVVC
jgi:hypothetical protein